MSPRPKNNTLIILWICIIVMLLISSIVIYIRLHHIAHSVVRVYQNGNLIATYALPQSDTIEVPIRSTNGDYNLLCITPNGAYIREANCPNQLCVQQGQIHNNLIPITCLPHRLVITLSTPDTDNTLDGQTY